MVWTSGCGMEEGLGLGDFGFRSRLVRVCHFGVLPQSGRISFGFSADDVCRTSTDLFRSLLALNSARNIRA